MQWVAKNQEDVVTKCYYAKKRLIWELLENGLKKKMEIHWDQISAMRVITTESGHMILEIEVQTNTISNIFSFFFSFFPFMII